VLGTIVAAVMFSGLGIATALIIAVLLAPTDAALGQAVVADERLPSRLRQGLNVESGLNDGICVPLLFAAIAFAELEAAPGFDGQILIDLVTEVGIALVVGVIVSAVTVLVVRQSLRRAWMEADWILIVPLATTAIAYGSAVALHASGFIAAFVAGLVYGRMLGQRAHATVLLDEEIGQLLSAITFFVFAASALEPLIDEIRLSSVVYAALSLTLIRIVPVAVSLVGSRASWQTALFAGWFGPRGLASIVFMLVVVEEADLDGTDRIVEVATLTVLMSVFAHGLTAIPLTNRYVEWFAERREQLDYERHAFPVRVRTRGLAARRADQEPVRVTDIAR
jgi:NhaP-type Na+/H+ or K+/H+ antiporter